MVLAGSDRIDDPAWPDGTSPLFPIRGGAVHPAHDGPHAPPRVLAVRDVREASAQFGHGGQLAALIPSMADRGRSFLIHHEHTKSLGRCGAETR